MGWRWDEPGAPLSQIWDRQESGGLTPSAEGMIECSTEARGAAATPRPNAGRPLAPRTQALTPTGAQPGKYQVKQACCATGLQGGFREGRRVGQGRGGEGERGGWGTGGKRGKTKE